MSCVSQNRCSGDPLNGVQGTFSQDVDGPLYEEVRDQGHYGYYVTPDGYSMANLATQGTGATYTSLDRGSMDKNTQYMVPHSPVPPKPDTDNYLEVVPSGGGSQEYLELVKGNETKDEAKDENQSPELDPVTGEIYSYVNEQFDMQ